MKNKRALKIIDQIVSVLSEEEKDEFAYDKASAATVELKKLMNKEVLEVVLEKFRACNHPDQVLLLAGAMSESPSEKVRPALLEKLLAWQTNKEVDAGERANLITTLENHVDSLVIWELLSELKPINVDSEIMEAVFDVIHCGTYAQILEDITSEFIELCDKKRPTKADQKYMNRLGRILFDTFSEFAEE